MLELGTEKNLIESLYHETKQHIILKYGENQYCKVLHKYSPPVANGMQLKGHEILSYKYTFSWKNPEAGFNLGFGIKK